MTRALVGNTADRRQVREGKKKENAADRQRRADWKQIMALPAGQRCIRFLMEITHIYNATFSHDPLWMAHNEGERNVGLQLLKELQMADPATFYTAIMLKDAQERAKDAEHSEAHAESEHEEADADASAGTDAPVVPEPDEPEPDDA